MPAMMMNWIEADQSHSARWFSGSGLPAPTRVVIADDRLTADAAFRLASEGTALLWRGDFQNAKQLLQAMARRVERSTQRLRKHTNAASDVLPDTANAFHAHRQAQGQRARTLGKLLVPLDPGYVMPLRRAPDVHAACVEAFGTPDAVSAAVISLRELQGLIGAYEWRKKGIMVEVLGARIHPHYGVFAPIRSEYVRLVAEAKLPALGTAFDIGTGTGVLAAVLAKRGVRHIIATDLDEKALACARDNLDQLGFAEQVILEQADLFPAGRANLIVCNPPWVPARPSSPLEHAVYDPDSRMLRGFLNGLCAHLHEQGEGWLILSDLAEHLGLRSRADLLAMIENAGLRVLGRNDIRPQHPRATDTNDPLHAARHLEVTSLWRLGTH